jgi:thiamine biosynthesis lipoprotein
LYSYNFNIFKSPCKIILDTPRKDFADEVVTLIYNRAKRLENCYGFFKDDSELSYINNRKKNNVVISNELAGLLKLSQFYYKKTSGIFDVAYAGTMYECQNMSSIAEYEQKKISLLPYASFSNLSLDGNTLHFSNPFTKIDLGGLVKEYAVDETILLLKELKITAALVDFGGDISVMGNYYSDEWKVGIQSPKDYHSNIKKISLHEGALCTSGHSKNFHLIEDKYISHIISQKASKYQQVSIIATTAIDAGVWSTTLLINPSVKLPPHVVLAAKI